MGIYEYNMLPEENQCDTHSYGTSHYVVFNEALREKLGKHLPTENVHKSKGFRTSDVSDLLRKLKLKRSLGKERP